MNRQQFEITPHQREQMVINYISEHLGCTRADITRGLENMISKKTSDKIVGKMIADGMVETKKEKPNSRDIKLFVKETNLLVAVPKQLEQFDKAFTVLINKTGQKIMELVIAKPLSKQLDISNDPFVNLSSQQTFQLLDIKLTIFFRLIDSILLQSLIIWPKQIKDKKILKELYFSVFSKIVDMALKFSEQHNDASFWKTSLELQIIKRLHGVVALGEFQEIYENVGMKQEIDAVVDSLWNIDKGIQDLAYKEKKYLGIDFKEGANWRDILALVKHKRKRKKH